MRGSHTPVTPNFQKVHEQHLCEIHHPLHALQWPNTVVKPTPSIKEERKQKPKSLKKSLGVYALANNKNEEDKPSLGCHRLLQVCP